MIGGAVLNAAAFTCDNYFAKYLSGDGKTALKEKTRHDKALKDHQAATAKYTTDRTMLLDWTKTIRKINKQAKQNITNAHYAFQLRRTQTSK